MTLVLNLSLNDDNVRLLNNYRLAHIYNYFSNVKGNNPTSNEHVIIDDTRQGSIFNMLSDMKEQLPYERFINSKSYDNGFDIQIASIYGELSNSLKKYYNKLNATDVDGYSIDSMHIYIAEPLLSSELESRKIYDLIKNKNGSYNMYDLNDIANSYNDIHMLKEADYGVFFQAPQHIKDEFPDIDVVNSHTELKELFISKSQFVERGL